MSSGLLIWKLRAVSATGCESLAAFGEMTATGKRIHVVQCPNHELVLGQRPEETLVVDKLRDPMQMDYLLVADVATAEAGAGRWPGGPGSAAWRRENLHTSRPMTHFGLEALPVQTISDRLGQTLYRTEIPAGGKETGRLRRWFQLGGVPQPDVDAVLVQPHVELLCRVGSPSIQQSG